MKVALDFQSAHGRPTGIGTFARTLVNNLAKLAPEIELVCYGDPRHTDLNTIERMTWESIVIPFKALHDKPDVIYSPGFAPPIFSSAPKIVTVHDLIGMLYPLNQGRVSRIYWSKWLPFCLKRAQKLVASSEATKQDVKKLLHVSENRVEVVPLAANPCFDVLKDRRKIDGTLSKYGIILPYFISVGTLEPRKNLINLLKAYELNQKRDKGRYHLVIVGKPGIAQKTLETYIAEKSLSSYIHLLGYVGEDDLVCLYNAALGYVTVSLHEGFGLPALEAMHCGISGISSNRTSLPEVVGDTAILVDPENVNQIADALNEFSQNFSLRDSLSRKAYERSKLFSLDVMTQKMINIFKQICPRA